jgi:hypothetical protein
MVNYDYSPAHAVTLISKHVREYGHDGLDGYALDNMIKMIGRNDNEDYTDNDIMTAIWALANAWIQHQDINGSCCNPLGK